MYSNIQMYVQFHLRQNIAVCRMVLHLQGNRFASNELGSQTTNVKLDSYIVLC